MRMRVRTALVLIGIVATVLGVSAGLSRRSESFRRLAAYHDQAAGFLVVEKVGEVCPDMIAPNETIEDLIARRGEDARSAYRAACFHQGLSEKYGRAASRPWLLVAADPPAPEGAYPAFAFDAGASAPQVP